jgi:UDP-N-acetylmuramoyl-L-alanyl-D-glutamate--2,6-diaminopimelate ligase
MTLAGYLSHKLKLIGVIGANGKTTTACLIAGILNHSGRKTGLLGKLGCFDGEEVVAEDNVNQKSGPAPDPLTYHLRRMEQNGCTHAVMEVSPRVLRQCRAADVQFDALCVANAAPNKQPVILPAFQSLRGEGFAVVNADGPGMADLLQQFDGPALTVGIDSPAEISGEAIEQSLGEQTFLIAAGNETAAVRTTMIGKHHIYHCLTAAATGLAYGVDLIDIVRSLEVAGHVPGRLERIECGQPFGVFVDCARSPGALENSLQTLRTVVSGRLICVFGADGRRRRAIRPEMGRTVERLADAAVVTGDSPRNKKYQKNMEEILSGFADRRRAEAIPDRKKAIRHALRSARPGDCVLIAGNGRAPHDDREVSRKWLYDLQ